MEEYTLEEMAKVLGIGVSTLRNRLSKGEGHPPYHGRGKAIRFPKDAYIRWRNSQLVYEVKKRAS